MTSPQLLHSVEIAETGPGKQKPRDVETGKTLGYKKLPNRVTERLRLLRGRGFDSNYRRSSFGEPSAKISVGMPLRVEMNWIGKKMSLSLAAQGIKRQNTIPELVKLELAAKTFKVENMRCYNFYDKT